MRIVGTAMPHMAVDFFFLRIIRYTSILFGEFATASILAIEPLFAVVAVNSNVDIRAMRGNLQRLISSGHEQIIDEYVKSQHNTHTDSYDIRHIYEINIIMGTCDISLSRFDYTFFTQCHYYDEAAIVVREAPLHKQSSAFEEQKRKMSATLRNKRPLQTQNQPARAAFINDGYYFV